MKKNIHRRSFQIALLLVALVGASYGQRRNGNSNNGSNGKFLFEVDTFDGNGRTCRTCHSEETGTVSPEDAQQRFLANPDDPLFLHDGSDDGNGNGAMRMLSRATILVSIPLPPNVRLAGSPNVRSVVLRRGIPTTLNTPALDPVLMLDGREPDLQTQAADAIQGHALGTVPSFESLTAIAEFEQTNKFFSSRALRNFANGGSEPVLPDGETDAERRGRLFFEEGGQCAFCHGGAMLNQTPSGERFRSVSVSEFNDAGNPEMRFIFNTPGLSPLNVSSPDPGRALITGNSEDVNAFKIPTLWGISRTAPYFHDNSAQTLEELLAHYARFFASFGVTLTPEDQADIIAFLKLL